MELKIKYRSNTYRTNEYYLRKRYGSKANLPTLIKALVAKAVAEEAQKELDEIQSLDED